eukprot:717142-Hanusia_phi.AAC.3
MGSEGEGAEESEESDGEGDGFKSQRLVVKLDKVQEKKLKKQLQDIDKLNGETSSMLQAQPDRWVPQSQPIPARAA